MDLLKVSAFLQASIRRSYCVVVMGAFALTEAKLRTENYEREWCSLSLVEIAALGDEHSSHIGSSGDGGMMYYCYLEIYSLQSNKFSSLADFLEYQLQQKERTMHNLKSRSEFRLKLITDASDVQNRKRVLDFLVKWAWSRQPPFLLFEIVKPTCLGGLSTRVSSTYKLPPSVLSPQFRVSEY